MKRNRIERTILAVALAVLMAACDTMPATRVPTQVPTETPLPLSGVRISTLPPPASSTPIPVPHTPAPPTVVPLPSATPGCSLQAAFIADVTIPDGSSMTPNSQFVKTWRIKNSGTCDWGAGFAVIFVEGNRLGGPATVSVPPADAGRSLDVSITLKAPAEPGAYKGKWQLRAPSGTVLTSLTVSIAIEATPTPAATATLTATAKPTPVPTFAATIDSFVGLWYVVTEKFGGNMTDTQRLQQIQINKSGSQLLASPATTFGSPYGFGLTGFASASYSGGPRMQWDFQDPARGDVSIAMKINKLCNATVKLSYPGFSGAFIIYQPHCTPPGSED